MEQKQRLLLDGIRYAMEMADFGYTRLRQTLETISTSPESEDNRQGHISAFFDAWMIIDSVHRLHSLLRLVPGADEADFVVAFRKKTEQSYLLRNRIQHLHGRLDKLVSDKEPTWGCLTWVTWSPATPDRGNTHLLAAGSLRESAFQLENPAGKTIDTSLDLIALRAHGEVVYLREIQAELQIVRDHLERALAEHFKELPTAAADLYVTLQFVLGNPVDSAARTDA